MNVKKCIEGISIISMWFTNLALVTLLLKLSVNRVGNGLCGRKSRKALYNVLDNSFPNSSHFYNGIEKETKNNDNQFDTKLRVITVIFTTIIKLHYFCISTIMSSRLIVQPTKYIFLKCAYLV